MIALPHHYQVELSGAASGYLPTRAPGLPELRLASPADYGGPGDAWSPEHLFIASVASCVMLTFRAVARASKLEFSALELSAEGLLDRREGVTQFIEVTVRARLVVKAPAERERALRVLEKAERSCLVTASLKTPVRLLPEIVEEKPASAPPTTADTAG